MTSEIRFYALKRKKEKGTGYLVEVRTVDNNNNNNNNGNMNIYLSAFAPENLVSRDGSAVPSRVSLLISILRLNLVLTYGIPPEFRGGVHLIFFKPPYAIGSVPS